jgi:hypothetical protein
LPISRAAVLTVLFAALPPLAAHAGAAASDRQIIMLLDRIGFGPTKAEVTYVKAIGIEAYINEQLHPASIPEPPQLTARLAALTTLKLDPGELLARYGPLPPVGGVKPTRQQQMARFKAARIIAQQAAAARVWRALYSPRQLKEVLVDFWFNHFNVFTGKGLDHLFLLCHLHGSGLPLGLKAAWASRQGGNEAGSEAPPDGGDGVRHMALRPDRGRRGVGNRGVAQVP